MNPWWVLKTWNDTRIIIFQPFEHWTWRIHSCLPMIGLKNVHAFSNSIESIEINQSFFATQNWCFSMLEQTIANLFVRARSLCVFIATSWLGSLLPLLLLLLLLLLPHPARTFPFRQILISLIKEFTYRKNSRLCVSKIFRKTYFFFSKKTQDFWKIIVIFSVLFTVCLVVYSFGCLFHYLLWFCNLFGTCALGVFEPDETSLQSC